MGKRKGDESQPGGPVSLKTLAAYLNLDPTTISVVLNDVPGRSIPEATRERIRKAALKFNYQPSFLARSLRNRRTMTVGILVPVLADGYHAEVMTGIGDRLLEENYFYFIAHHRHRPDLIEQYPRMLISRGAEGLIAIDTNLTQWSHQCSARPPPGRGAIASPSLRFGASHDRFYARAAL
jgi:DNA-binding LacI/PurR family transcriptional regulator